MKIAGAFQTRCHTLLMFAGVRQRGLSIVPLFYKYMVDNKK